VGGVHKEQLHQNANVQQRQDSLPSFCKTIIANNSQLYPALSKYWKLSEHVARIGQKKYAYRILVGEPEWTIKWT
jgi:hypothetical protein